jgi:hypothetical protein
LKISSPLPANTSRGSVQHGLSILDSAANPKFSMTIKNSPETRIHNAVTELETDFLRKDYLRVVLLAPQLLVQVIEVLGSYTEDWLRRKGLLDHTEDEMKAHELMQRLSKRESDRAYIASALFATFEGEREKAPDALVNFERSFNKLERLVSMRNHLAHEFYSKKVSVNRLKASASGGIDLLKILTGELRDDEL